MGCQLCFTINILIFYLIYIGKHYYYVNNKFFYFSKRFKKIWTFYQLLQCKYHCELQDYSIRSRVDHREYQWALLGASEWISSNLLRRVLSPQSPRIWVHSSVVSKGWSWRLCRLHLSLFVFRIESHIPTRSSIQILHHRCWQPKVQHERWEIDLFFWEVNNNF